MCSHPYKPLKLKAPPLLPKHSVTALALSFATPPVSLPKLPATMTKIALSDNSIHSYEASKEAQIM
jgi:hypothetical protein